MKAHNGGTMKTAKIIAFPQRPKRQSQPRAEALPAEATLWSVFAERCERNPRKRAVRDAATTLARHQERHDVVHDQVHPQDEARREHAHTHH
jgi:hypothetical protein